MALILTVLVVKSQEKVGINAKAKEAFGPEKQYNLLKNKYQQGNRNPDFLRALSNESVDADDSNFYPTVINSYLSKG